MFPAVSVHGKHSSKMAKAIVHYGSGLLNLTEQHRGVFEQVDGVYIVKEQCFHCFIDSEVSIEEDLEEARTFRKSFDTTLVKHIYCEFFCRNKYHARANALVWEEFLQELNRYNQVILLESLHWLFDLKTQVRLSKESQNLEKNIRNRLVVNEEQASKPQTLEIAPSEEHVGQAVKRTGVEEVEKDNLSEEEKTSDEEIVETKTSEHVAENDIFIPAFSKREAKQEGKVGSVVETSVGDSSEARLPLSTLRRREYTYIPSIDDNVPLEVVAAESPEEMLTRLDILLLDDNLTKPKDSINKDSVVLAGVGRSKDLPQKKTYRPRPPNGGSQ